MTKYRLRGHEDNPIVNISKGSGKEPGEDNEAWRMQNTKAADKAGVRGGILHCQFFIAS
jgi:hypothetical protein